MRVSEAVSKHAPEGRKSKLDEWFSSLDEEDHEVVSRIITDPTWSGQRFLRLLRDLGVHVSKETVNQWRRDRGFRG